MYKLSEKVQRRATRLMTNDKSLSHYDRLKKSGLTTLRDKKITRWFNRSI